MIQRILFELGLLWAEIIRWVMTKDPVTIIGLGIVIILILHLVLVIVTEPIGGRR